MIVTEFSPGKISVNGHAGYAPAGEADIVCATVSVLRHIFTGLTVMLILNPLNLILNIINYRQNLKLRLLTHNVLQLVCNLCFLQYVCRHVLREMVTHFFFCLCQLLDIEIYLIRFNPAYTALSVRIVPSDGLVLYHNSCLSFFVIAFH